MTQLPWIDLWNTEFTEQVRLAQRHRYWKVAPTGDGIQVIINVSPALTANDFQKLADYPFISIDKQPTMDRFYGRLERYAVERSGVGDLRVTANYMTLDTIPRQLDTRQVDPSKTTRGTTLMSETIGQLPGKWRAQAKDEADAGYQCALENCADELEQSMARTGASIVAAFKAVGDAL